MWKIALTTYYGDDVSLLHKLLSKASPIVLILEAKIARTRKSHSVSISIVLLTLISNPPSSYGRMD